eukprot:1101858-Rhodomonas_salina.1
MEELALPGVMLVGSVAVWTDDECRPERGLAWHGCSGCSSNVRVDNWRHDVCATVSSSLPRSHSWDDPNQGHVTWQLQSPWGGVCWHYNWSWCGFVGTTAFGMPA